MVYGCGRTDSGVHASQYFFHVDIDETIDFDFPTISFNAWTDGQVKAPTPAQQKRNAPAVSGAFLFRIMAINTLLLNKIVNSAHLAYFAHLF